MISKLLNSIQANSAYVASAYNDAQSQVFKDFQAQKGSNSMEMFELSIQTINETAEIEDQIMTKSNSQESTFDLYVKQIIDECQKIFTSEESNGKYLDLNSSFLRFVNIKQIESLNLQNLKIPNDYLSWL